MYYMYIRVAVSVALSCYASIYRGFCNLYFTIFNKKSDRIGALFLVV